MIRVLVVDPENRTAANAADALEGQKMLPTVVCRVGEALQQLHSNPRMQSSSRPHQAMRGMKGSAERSASEHWLPCW